MKHQKAISVLLVLLLFLVSCSANSPPKETRLSAKGCDFRKAHWGDSMDTISKNAVETLESSEHVMDGKVNILGYIADIEYVVLDNGLFGGMYSIDISSKSKDEYTAIYNTLAKQLSAEYGNPTFSLDKQVWWETNTTNIIIDIDRDSENIPSSVSILYLAKDFS